MAHALVIFVAVSLSKAFGTTVITIVTSWLAIEPPCNRHASLRVRPSTINTSEYTANTDDFKDFATPPTLHHVLITWIYCWQPKDTRFRLSYMAPTNKTRVESSTVCMHSSRTNGYDHVTFLHYFFLLLIRETKQLSDDCNELHETLDAVRRDQEHLQSRLVKQKREPRTNRSNTKGTILI